MAAARRGGAANRAGRIACAKLTVVTGIIVELTPAKRIGVIRTQDGSRVLFSASAVLDDFDTLAVGNRVRFDLERVWPQQNVVRVLREPSRSAAPNKLEPALDLRYGGFNQTENIRSYRFDAVASGHFIQHFIVTVDLGLLLKHHIGVQEAPTLCLRKLVGDLRDSPELQQHELGNDDLLAYALSRAAVSQRKKSKPFGGRRGSPPPVPWKRRSTAS